MLKETKEMEWSKEEEEIREKLEKVFDVEQFRIVECATKGTRAVVYID